MVQIDMSTESRSPMNLVILGAGGFAREVAWLIANINQLQPKTWNVIGFWEQGAERIGQLINGVPVVGADSVRQYVPNLYAVAAIADPKSKERAVQEAHTTGCKFATLIHPTVQYDQSTIKIGPGTIICGGSILSVNIAIGAHVIINLDCTIGHDTIIEDYATILPGCHIAGYTTIRRSALLGAGMVTIPRCEIGASSVIGAGAVVVRNIPPNARATGVPAKTK